MPKVITVRNRLTIQIRKYSSSRPVNLSREIRGSTGGGTFRSADADEGSVAVSIHCRGAATGSGGGAGGAVGSLIAGGVGTIGTAIEAADDSMWMPAASWPRWMRRSRVSSADETCTAQRGGLW